MHQSKPLTHNKNKLHSLRTRSLATHLQIAGAVHARSSFASLCRNRHFRRTRNVQPALAAVWPHPQHADSSRSSLAASNSQTSGHAELAALWLSCTHSPLAASHWQRRTRSSLAAPAAFWPCHTRSLLAAPYSQPFGRVKLAALFCTRSFLATANSHALAALCCTRSSPAAPNPHVLAALWPYSQFSGRTRSSSAALTVLRLHAAETPGVHRAHS